MSTYEYVRRQQTKKNRHAQSESQQTYSINGEEEAEEDHSSTMRARLEQEEEEEEYAFSNNRGNDAYSGNGGGMVRIETTTTGEHRIAQNAAGHNVVHISVPEYDPDDDLEEDFFESIALYNKQSKKHVGSVEGGKEFPGDFPNEPIKISRAVMIRRTLVKIGVLCLLLVTALVASIVAYDTEKRNERPKPPIDTNPNAPPPIGVSIPLEFEETLAEWFDPNGNQPGVSASPSKGIRDDVPLYWSIPLSANLVVEDILGTCLNLVLAGEIGIVDGHDDDNTLKIVQLYGSAYVNVDISTKDGIDRAVHMNLIPSNIVDVLHTPLLHDATKLFTKPFVSQARVFTVLRHPIDRATAVYKYVRESRIQGHEDLQSMTLEEYAASSYVENNWLTRFLTEKLSPEKKLTEKDVQVAKEVLRRKVLIGMYDDILESMQLFQSHFHWTEDEDDLVTQCTERAAEEGMSKEESVDPPLEEGSEAWNLLMEQNQYDMDLYMYARALHQYQLDRVMGRRRLIDEKDIEGEFEIDEELYSMDVPESKKEVVPIPPLWKDW